LAKASPKSAGAKRAARKRVRPVKARSTLAVETVIVDVVEEPVPGVISVTEIEATEVVAEPSAGPEEPEGSQGSEPPDSEEP
jgi:hypothetical protein